MERSTNLLTIFADASYKDGWAGYAYWSRGATERTFGSSPISWKVQHIHEAETIGLCAGIEAALNELPHQLGVILVVQSDSLAALGVFLHYPGVGVAKSSDCPIVKSTGNSVQQAFVESTINTITLHQGRLWLKHVRGHHKTEDAKRSAANSWCDKHAGKARKEAEQKYGLKNSCNQLQNNS